MLFCNVVDRVTLILCQFDVVAEWHGSRFVFVSALCLKANVRDFKSFAYAYKEQSLIHLRLTPLNSIPKTASETLKFTTKNKICVYYIW